MIVRQYPGKSQIKVKKHQMEWIALIKPKYNLDCKFTRKNRTLLELKFDRPLKGPLNNFRKSPGFTEKDLEVCDKPKASFFLESMIKVEEDTPEEVEIIEETQLETPTNIRTRVQCGRDSISIDPQETIINSDDDNRIIIRSESSSNPMNEIVILKKDTNYLPRIMLTIESEKWKHIPKPKNEFVINKKPNLQIKKANTNSLPKETVKNHKLEDEKLKVVGLLEKLHDRMDLTVRRVKPTPVPNNIVKDHDYENPKLKVIRLLEKVHDRLDLTVKAKPTPVPNNRKEYLNDEHPKLKAIHSQEKLHDNSDKTLNQVEKQDPKEKINNNLDLTVRKLEKNLNPVINKYIDLSDQKLEPVEYMTSTHGVFKVIHNNFTYIQKLVNNKNMSTIWWGCDKMKSNKCPATIKTFKGFVYREMHSHNHEPSTPRDLEIAKIRAEMKDRALTTDDSAKKILKSILPKNQTLFEKEDIRKLRRKLLALRCQKRNNPKWLKRMLDIMSKQLTILISHKDFEYNVVES